MGGAQWAWRMGLAPWATPLGPAQRAGPNEPSRFVLETDVCSGIRAKTSQKVHFPYQHMSAENARALTECILSANGVFPWGGAVLVSSNKYGKEPCGQNHKSVWNIRGNLGERWRMLGPTDVPHHITKVMLMM